MHPLNITELQLFVFVVEIPPPLVPCVLYFEAKAMSSAVLREASHDVNPLLQRDLPKCGTSSESRRVAIAIELFNVDVWTHLQDECAKCLPFRAVVIFVVRLSPLLAIRNTQPLPMLTML